MGILCGSGILIHAQHPRIREQLCQLFLGFLGAEAPVLQLAAAGGADGGRFHLAAAVVAQYLVRRFVVHHRTLHFVHLSTSRQSSHWAMVW